MDPLTKKKGDYYETWGQKLELIMSSELHIYRGTNRPTGKGYYFQLHSGPIRLLIISDNREFCHALRIHGSIPKG